MDTLLLNKSYRREEIAPWLKSQPTQMRCRGTLANFSAGRNEGNRSMKSALVKLALGSGNSSNGRCAREGDELEESQCVPSSKAPTAALPLDAVHLQHTGNLAQG